MTPTEIQAQPLQPERLEATDYSQSGEGQILLDLLSRLPERSKTCVEIGAADGIVFSNTRILTESFGYRAVLVESDPKWLVRLERNLTGDSIALNVNVHWNQAGRKLDDLPIPPDCDFMSIDIDGNDYHVWAAMKTFRPKIICIEYNPTIPNEVSFVQEPNEDIHHGCSLLALIELAKAKGYELAGGTVYNAFFVTRELFPFMEIGDNRISTFRPAECQPKVTYLFTGYDGHVFLRGHQVIPWASVRLREQDLQAMPEMFQKYRLTGWQAVAFGWWRRLKGVLAL